MVKKRKKIVNKKSTAKKRTVKPAPKKKKGGAPKGNQFWKLRSKHGRNKLFATPKLLWSAACEYFQWCDDNPLIEIDFMGKEITRVEIPKMRPYTIHGLCLYFDASTSFWREFKSNCKENSDKDFLSVIMRIEEVIYNQKFSGAASGFLNPNIIARDLGLQDKQTQTLQNPDGTPLMQNIIINKNYTEKND